MVENVVVFKEDNVIPAQWPITRIVKVNPEIVRVVTLKTITKLGLLLPCE